MSEHQSSVTALMPTDEAGSHLSITAAMWQVDSFSAERRIIRGADMAMLKIGGFSLIVTLEQWRAIADAMDSALSEQVTA